MLQRKMKVARKEPDAAVRNALDSTAKRMREEYSLPENWTRTRGVALIDKGSQTLVGNFSEYKHIRQKGVRKLLREHTPIGIDAVEEVDGYLGQDLELKLTGRTWEVEHHVVCDLLLDELSVEAPHVMVKVCTRLGGIIRADLEEDTQFASASGNTILLLPKGTDIFFAASTDTKIALRRKALA